MIDKRRIDLLVAKNTGVPQKTVTTVTAEFVSVICQELARNGVVRIRGLGAFRVFTASGLNNYIRKQTTMFRVSFAQGTTLKQHIQRNRYRHER